MDGISFTVHPPTQNQIPSSRSPQSVVARSSAEVSGDRNHTFPHPPSPGRRPVASSLTGVLGSVPASHSSSSSAGRACHLAWRATGVMRVRAAGPPALAMAMEHSDEAAGVSAAAVRCGARCSTRVGAEDGVRGGDGGGVQESRRLESSDEPRLLLSDRDTTSVTAKCLQNTPWNPCLRRAGCFHSFMNMRQQIRCKLDSRYSKCMHYSGIIVSEFCRG